MSNTVISVDIRSFPDSIRRKAPELIDTANKLRNASNGGGGGGNATVPKPAYGILSPVLSGDGQTRITVDLNAPAILAGPQLKQGTSAFADARGALELTRIDLARAGVPKDALNLLNSTHVSFQTVRVPFLFLSTAKTDAAASAALVRKSRGKKAAPSLPAGFLLPPEPGHAKPAPAKVNLPMQPYASLLGLEINYGADNQTVEYRARSEEEGGGVVVIVERQEFGPVRVDVLLDESYLQSHGWITLDSWRDAYADGRYPYIFKEVRKLFRFDGTDQRIEEPTQFSSDEEKDILREYFKGGKNFGPLLRFAFKMSDGQKKTAMKAVRKSILEMRGIDIETPWEKFRRYGCPVLGRNLVYPGDFKPDAEQAPSYFCERNWPALLNGLRDAYQGVAQVD